MTTTVPILFAFGISQFAMLWWLGAAAAPLLIHLLSRRRYREAPWAAVEFLLAALQKSARRLRAEQWLLLLIRTAIIVCVVIAVAGPYVERPGGTLAIGEPVHKILVLDGSYSMDYKPGDATRFQIARRLAEQIVAHSSQGDGFSLVLMAEPSRTIVGSPAFVGDDVREALLHSHGDVPTASPSPQPPASSLSDDLVRELRNARIQHAGGDLAGALDRVDEIVIRAKKEFPRLSRTEVYFLTDLGRTSWDVSATAAAKKTRGRLAQLADAARVTIVDLGQDHSDNLAITSLVSRQSVFTSRTPIAFSAQVQNFGDAPQHGQIELWVDGQRFQSQPLDVPPRGQQSAAFEHRFDAPGDHAVEARLAGDPLDKLDVDNHRWLAAPVKESISALVVNGEGSRDQGRFLVDALDPYRDGSGELPVHVQQIADGTLLDADLRQFDCIFLSNVGQFTPAEARALSDFAKSGGGLVIFLGDRVDAANYNLRLGAAVKDGRVLPAELDKPADAGRYNFDPLDYKDPLLAPFAGNERAGLLNTSITRYFRLKRFPPRTPAAQTALAIRQTQEPAIISERLAGAGGEPGGRSIVVALPASFASVDPLSKEPWSNWPIKYSFQPMVQNLLLAAVGTAGGERNLPVGRRLESSLAKGSASGSLTIERPDRRTEQIRIAAHENSNRWTYDNTWQSGIYRAQASGGEDRLFAVNVNTAESDLTRIDPHDLPETIAVATGWNGVEGRPAADVGASSGQQRWFLFAALALLILETILAWWFGWRSA
jgi:hypothetical protein